MMPSLSATIDDGLKLFISECCKISGFCFPQKCFEFYIQNIFAEGFECLLLSESTCDLVLEIYPAKDKGRLVPYVESWDSISEMGAVDFSPLSLNALCKAFNELDERMESICLDYPESAKEAFGD